MKKQKYLLISIFLSFIFLCNYSCTRDCADMLPEESLDFSFTVKDSAGNDYQYKVDVDSIKIFELENPDVLANYDVQYTSIGLYLGNYDPHIGEHDRKYSIYWEQGDIDTLRVVYSVGEVPEDECFYKFNISALYFNNVQYYKNPKTNLYDCIKE